MAAVEDERSLINLVDELSIQDRAKARESYRELICIAQNAAADGEAAQVDINVIKKGIEETTRVFSSGQVLLPTEGTYDAEALKHFSELFIHKVQSQKDEALQFNSGEYACRLVAQVKALGDERAGNTSEFPTMAQWAEFGKTVGSLLRRAPAFHYLYGSFSRDVQPPEVRGSQRAAQTPAGQTQAAASSQTSQAPATQRKQQNRLAALINEQAPLTQPKTVGNASDMAESEETTRMVDLVRQRLRTVYQKNNNSPISYFEFVLDPTSFVQTVENMFYVSFLVKDGRVGIDLDETGLPVLVVHNDSAPTATSTTRLGACNQCIMTINKDNWRALVDAFNVQEAVLNFRR